MKTKRATSSLLRRKYLTLYYGKEIKKLEKSRHKLPPRVQSILLQSSLKEYSMSKYKEIKERIYINLEHYGNYSLIMRFVVSIFKEKQIKEFLF